MEWSRSVPITVLTLARPELLERRPAWGAGKRSFTSVYLEPLPTNEMQQLLAGLVPGLPAPAIDRIVARADGIPLYAVETVRMLLAQGQLVLEGETYRPAGNLDDLAVPETLTALIAARLDGLDPTDRALVEDAAVLGQSFTVAGLAAVSGQPAESLEARLSSLVRRELLVHDVDPRSPERGQYAFVQALIREVAYNTLSKKDRKARHLAAARHFETIATDELAGGLAGHYLAAQRLAADEAEASALAAQARIALRGAAERAAALGSYEQGGTFLEQAIEVTTDAADRAELHARAAFFASHTLETEPVLRHGAAAEAERRKTGDREGIAIAAALHVRAFNVYRADPVAALGMLEPLWEEFSDLEQTAAGVALMTTFVRVYRSLAESRNALEWVDRLLPIAERLGDLESIANGLLGRGASLALIGRPREGLVLMRGAHQLALANDLRDPETGCRILLTFYEQWGDPAAGLALGREGLEIGRRIGSRVYRFQMVGNASISAIRVGEWDWVAAMLEEWLEDSEVNSNWIEFHVDRAMLHAHRGMDVSEDLEWAARLQAGVTDPQYESYELWARAVANMLAGDYTSAIEQLERAVALTPYFSPLLYPVAARAALWAGDAATARRLRDTEARAGDWGPVLAADRMRIDAGIAALEGRAAEALAGFVDALRAYAQINLPFEEAACAVDMSMLLPGVANESAVAAAAIESARETLTRLGAVPFLDRLERATASSGTGSKSGPGDNGVATGATGRAMSEANA